MFSVNIQNQWWWYKHQSSIERPFIRQWSHIIWCEDLQQSNIHRPLAMQCILYSSNLLQTNWQNLWNWCIGHSSQTIRFLLVFCWNADWNACFSVSM